jgi:copper(I)-binding protein
MQMRKVLIAGLSGLALTLSGALAGCGQKAEEPTAAASQTADATPENAPGITLSDAVVRLPAMAGRPGVAYFTLSQGAGAPRKIASVYVEGAGRAEMHETATENGVSSMKPVKEVLVEAGKTVEFKSGGLHVMLFDIADTLKAGGMTELTITLDNGDKASIPAKVEAFAAASGGMNHDMSGHDMSGHDMSKM